ncbi:PREDICTED: probable G-protein coupled receptor [Branchiostoma belcheri]|uniref:Probable G-protein coupled receptor n=1 Tax=Branchiostoma belcheri TaxID=7741 RepID=A0A6P5AR29_BRABE|nr:PREDICTED: probable G-protein coupled receptor [Branchiostoma belcheri]XP_019644467.1 PREDICTED: probable G-protein coupled receptor [Branchiostoma belcheri]KAI8490684.1 G-protein coupled [Branchiostoma belcheri]
MEAMNHTVLVSEVNDFLPFPNVTNRTATYDSSVDDGASSTWLIFQLVAMTIVEIVALFSNVSVLIVVMKTPPLHTLTLLFVLNLCTTDLLHSLFVTPFFLASSGQGAWTYGTVACDVTGFLDSLFTYSSITTICVISVERYYSIVRPMVHAAHMTLVTALSVIAFIWVQAICLAVAPLVGWNHYVFDLRQTQCTYDWIAQGSGKSYVIAISCWYFYIPACVVLAMYSCIYSAAMKASRQVLPQPSPLMPEGQPASSPVLNGNTKVPMDLANGQKIFVITTADGEAGPSTSDGGGRRKSSTNKQDQTQKTHSQMSESLKATKTLMLVVGVFLLTWGPYFTVSTIVAILGMSPRLKQAIGPLKCLAHTSFAINAFVYGWLNRQVRLELMRTLRHYYRFICHQEAEGSDIELRAMEEDSKGLQPVENFYQFLERTATPDCRAASRNPKEVKSERENKTL